MNTPGLLVWFYRTKKQCAVTAELPGAPMCQTARARVGSIEPIQGISSDPTELIGSKGPWIVSRPIAPAISTAFVQKRRLITQLMSSHLIGRTGVNGDIMSSLLMWPPLPYLPASTHYTTCTACTSETPSSAHPTHRAHHERHTRHAMHIMHMLFDPRHAPIRGNSCHAPVPALI